jgi:hypothetical protein
MSALVTVPLILLMLGMAGGRWTHRRRDDKSIEAHRSTLGTIEHVAGADDAHGPGPDRNTAHVRIVAGAEPKKRRANEEEILPAKPPQRRGGRPSFPLPRDRRVEPQAAPPPAVAEGAPPRRSPSLSPEAARIIAEQVRAKLADSAAPDVAPSAPPASGIPSAPSITVRAITVRAITVRAITVRAIRVRAITVRAGRAASGVAALAAEARAFRSRVRSDRWTGRGLRSISRRSTLMAAAALVFAVAVAGGVTLATQAHHAPSATRGRSAGGRGSQAGSRPLIASSTTVPEPMLVATAATTSYASYTVNAASVNIDLSAGRACWIELRDASRNGPLVYQGTLQPGATQAFHAVGSVWMRLGDPSGVTVTIDGSAVNLPAVSNPYDLTVTSPA